jgi:hypothetical protein
MVKFADPTLVPLKLTPVAPVKPVPLIVTDVPTDPEGGENPLMVGVGEGDTVKSVELEAVPPGAVTEIFPVVAPWGTVAVILALETTVKLPDPTLVPLKLTPVEPVKPEPLIVTEVPTGPESGLTSEMAGVVTAPPQLRVPGWSTFPFAFL